MEYLYAALLPAIVWLVFVCLIAYFVKMHRWAKKRKGIAIAFGLFAQMFLPDPKVEQTIEFVREAKQKEMKKLSQAQADKDNKNE